MTSKQAMLWLSMPVALTAVMLGALTGCQALKPSPKPVEAIDSPYPTRRVWAVAPLLNESGSSRADGIALADQLARRLENARNLDVLPLNRTLAAMDALGIAQVTNEPEALAVMRALEVDGLVIGVISDFDVYEPLKIGLAIELYVSDRAMREQGADLTPIVTAPSGPAAKPSGGAAPSQPVSVVSAFYAADDPAVRQFLRRYATGRELETNPAAPHLWWISMDLYQEAISYLAARRLLSEEARRLTINPTPPAS